MKSVMAIVSSLCILCVSFTADAESELSRAEIRQVLDSMHQDYLAQPPYQAKVRVETIVNRSALTSSRASDREIHLNDVYNDTLKHRFAMRLHYLIRDARGEPNAPANLEASWNGKFFLMANNDFSAGRTMYRYSESPRFENHLKTFIESGHELDGLATRLGLDIEGKLGELNDLEYHYAPTLIHFMDSVKAIRRIEFGQELIRLRAKTPDGDYRVALREREGKWVLDTLERTRTVLQQPLLVPQFSNVSKVVTTVTVTAHKDFNGILIPVEGVLLELQTQNDGGMNTWVRLIRRDDIVVNPDFDALGVFEVELPIDARRRADHPNAGPVLSWLSKKTVPRE